MEFPKKVKSNNYNDYFPYAKYRKDQEEVIKEISEHVKNKGQYLLIAPNGTGKSIISLASTLPIVNSNNLKLIYLCRTHQQNDRIIKELNNDYCVGKLIHQIHKNDESLIMILII